MKCFPLVLAFVAISAAGFAIPPQPVADRHEVLPLVEPVSISIDDLALPITSRAEFHESKIPKQILQLEGKQVRLIGQMYPTFHETGIKKFLFNGDTRNESRPSSSSLKMPLQCFINVIMAEGTTATFTFEPVEITGRLVIKPERLGETVYLIYGIKHATVRPGKRQQGFRKSIIPWPC